MNTVSISKKQPREIIRDKLIELGMSMRDASLTIGKNPAYLQQYLDRGAPKELPRATRGQLGKLLRIPPSTLEEPNVEAVLAKKPRTPRSLRPFRPGSDLIPVLGLAEGGEEGWSIWNGDTVAFVDRPPALGREAKAYALFVTGSSMIPRYYPKETIYASPSRAITIGAFVVVQLRAPKEGEAPRALVKRLAKRLSNKIVLEQFNPPRTFDISVNDIVSMHRIVGAAE